jgi:hypothetical protein
MQCNATRTPLYETQMIRIIESPYQWEKPATQAQATKAKKY